LPKNKARIEPKAPFKISFDIAIYPNSYRKISSDGNFKLSDPPFAPSWHKRKTTNWHNWEPIYLPPYSPDLNPIQRIWLTMKARWFNNHVCKNEEKLLERLDQPILDVIDNPEKNQQTTAIGTLF